MEIVKWSERLIIRKFLRFLSKIVIKTDTSKTFGEQHK
jgi:hypothetical protein